MSQRNLGGNVSNISLSLRLTELEKKFNNLTSPVELTYQQLVAKYEAENLDIGTTYVIIDYKTNHIIPNTTIEAKLSVLAPTVEPIAVLAIANNQFAPQAYSLDYPEDILYYDITADWLGTLKPTEHTGIITRRIDTDLDIDIPCDWRQCVFRRWAVDLTAWGGNASEFALWDTTVTIGSDHSLLEANQIVLNAISVSTYKDVHIFSDNIVHKTNIRFGTAWDATSPLPNFYFDNVGGLGRVDTLDIKTFNSGNTIIVNGGEGFEHMSANFFQHNIFVGSGFHFAGHSGWITTNLVTVGLFYNCIFSDISICTLYTASTPNTVAITGRIQGIGNSQFKMDGTANGYRIDWEEILYANLYIDNTVNFNDGGGFDEPLNSTIKGLKPVIIDWNNPWRIMDFSAQPNIFYVAGIKSTIEASIAQAANITFNRFIDNNITYETEHAGIIKITGAGVAAIDTIEIAISGELGNHDLIIKPDAGVTVNIPFNNVNDGFINSVTATANGTNGEVILIRKVGADRWFAWN